MRRQQNLRDSDTDQEVQWALATRMCPDRPVTATEWTVAASHTVFDPIGETLAAQFRFGVDKIADTQATGRISVLSNPFRSYVATAS